VKNLPGAPSGARTVRIFSANASHVLTAPGNFTRALRSIISRPPLRVSAQKGQGTGPPPDANFQFLFKKNWNFSPISSSSICIVLLPVPIHFRPQAFTEPPALVRTLGREDVLWNRKLFKAPPLNVQPPAAELPATATFIATLRKPAPTKPARPA
jgi:hypothetical protein